MNKLYTVKQASKILGFSTNTVYKYLNEGYIKSARGNSQQGRFRIPQKSLEEFLGTKLSDIYKPKSSIEENIREPKKLVKAKEEKDEVEPKSPLHTPIPLTLKFTRYLILASLILIIADLFRSTGFSLAQQSVRIALVSIFVLIAYQFGGIKHKSQA
jgi:excisionase family DNA binding protein